MNIAFRTLLESPSGLRFMFDSLDTHSAMARRKILDSLMMRDEEHIMMAYDKVRPVIKLVEDRALESVIQLMQFKLCEHKDISATISRLSAGAMLDDVELFEIKHLTLLAIDVDAIAQRLCYDGFAIREDLAPVLKILDPDGMKIATFYIYDSYSEALRAARKKLSNDPDNVDLYNEALVIEDAVRRDIVKALQPYADRLDKVLNAIADIDIVLAKALQIKKYNLCIPEWSSEATTTMKNMFHPEVLEALKQQGDTFQCVDVTYHNGATLIIGANMGGKTVVLKTLAMCQYLFQFGFGIPAEYASMRCFDEVFFCIGDEQSSVKGLSSFAAEMKRIDHVIKVARDNPHILALIDEPARTTNPVEGTALVTALIDLLKNNGMSLLVTTHYNVDVDNCKRLRVRGLEGGKMNYELLEVVEGEVPHEALNIARSLDIDSEWLDAAASMLGKNEIA